MTRRACTLALLLAGAWAVPRAGAGEAARPWRPAPELHVFSLRQGRVTTPPRAPSGPLAIGSLAKPFVARAWARAHPGQPSPVLRCTPGSHCWNAAGHGTVGLVRAVAVSCNAYFRALAAETPAPTLAATLRDAGFVPPDPLSAEAAIGLPSEAGLVSAEPAAVLRAYAALVEEPWAGAETIRREVTAGLRDSAREGTAAALAGTGFAAKTGTVPALDGRALETSGWAVAIDEAGRGFLALLTPGTGREAARALARRLRGGVDPADEPAGSASPRPVRVSLFSALSPRNVRARNLGPAPVSGTRGFVGALGSLELRPGDRLGPGDWELTLPAYGLRRVVRGALRADAGPRDTLRVRVDVSRLEYVAGVIAAELPPADDALREALGAAVLRFLAEGPRHGDVDFCDLTHCAFFVGRGPRASWTTPSRVTLLEPPGGAPLAARSALSGPAAAGPGEPIDAAAWQRMLAASREDGPSRWTSHCGGEPLSAHAVWGGADRRVYRCDRHGPEDRAPWSRLWRQADVERAFGVVRDLRVTEDDGRWLLRVEREGRPLLLSWDEAHARLARVLGWGALPSPADRVVRGDGGYRAQGRGLGHRVGLCLGESALPALLD
ncbi:MAG: hypothetical protein ACM3PV_03770 [Betaproteobacteria bacterium]